MDLTGANTRGLTLLHLISLPERRNRGRGVKERLGRFGWSG